jgi:Kef-type K+ transport system membrane component KefB/Trk K+ transport system NAD-binding subunit
VHEETSFLSLLLVALLALVVPVITLHIRRVRIPTVVGEILAGIIVGKSGLDLVGEDPWLALLSTLGFAYLMFLSGLEIDFNAMIGQASQVTGALRERLRTPAALALVSFAITLPVAFLLALGLKAAGLVQDPLLMGLILSTTSLGLVVPTLKERGDLRTRYGQSLLMAALVADFATMLLISVYVIFHTSGLTLEMLLVLVLLGAFLTAYRVLLLLQRHPPLENLFARVASAAGHIQTRGAFTIGLAFIALAEQLGVEAILGAFLGGALIALLSEEGESPLREKLDAMGYGFFIPIFFIMVGVRFDLPALLSSPETLLLAPLLIVIAYAIKLASGLVFRLAYDWRQTIGAGLLLSSRLSLIIAAAAIGVDLGAISPGINSVIILLAIVSCTASPLLFNRLVPAITERRRRPVIVAGSDALAAALAQRLVTSHHEDTVVLAVPPGGALPLASSDGLQVLPMPEISHEALGALGAERAKTLVALLDDDALNLRLCQIATTAFQISNVVARVNDPANAEAYAAAGAYPVTLAGSQVTVLENLASSPNVFRLLADPRPGQEIVELQVRNPALVGTPVHALRLPGQALIMVIQRDGQFFVPRDETRLALHDVVTVLAAPHEADEVCPMFAGESC